MKIKRDVISHFSLSVLLGALILSTSMMGCSMATDKTSSYSKPINDSVSNGSQLKSASLEHHSIKMQCGASTFQFKATCFDELEGLSDRGSAGGVRNYCEDMSLHIKSVTGEKVLTYPMMPDYKVQGYRENGYMFSEKMDDERLTPQTFACAKTASGKNYLFVNYPYTHNTNQSSVLDRLNQKSVIVDMNGDYVGEDLADVLNKLERPDIVFLDSDTTNMMYLEM